MGPKTTTSSADETSTQPISPGGTEPCIRPRTTVARWVIGLTSTARFSQEGNVSGSTKTLLTKFRKNISIVPIHWTDAGVASWYDFAVAIREEARAMGILRRDIDIRPIGTDAFPTAARRPAYSVLDKRDSWNALTITPVHWRENLRKTLRELRT